MTNNDISIYTDEAYISGQFEGYTFEAEVAYKEETTQDYSPYTGWVSSTIGEDYDISAGFWRGDDPTPIELEDMKPEFQDRFRKYMIKKYHAL